MTVKKLYDRAADHISLKKIYTAAVILTVLVLIPILYLGPFGRATGDDLGNSAAAHRAWLAGEGLAGVLRAAAANVRSMYISWEGCYTSDFLYALQPEVFGRGCYAVVPFINLFLWFGSLLFFMHQILRRIFRLGRMQTFASVLLFWILTVEFIPSTQNSIYWWAGTAHYTFAMAVCLTCAGLGIGFILGGSTVSQVVRIVLMTALAAILGGVNYQAALLGFLLIFFAGVYGFICTRDKKILFLLIPLFTEGAGLMISVTAPGNALRGGSGMEFTAGRLIQTVGLSFAAGFKEGVEFTFGKPVLLLGMLMLTAIMTGMFAELHAADGSEAVKVRLLPVVAVICFCIYAAMEAPLIFADVTDATTGPVNTDYQVLYMVIFGLLVIGADRMGSRIAAGKKGKAYHRYVLLPLILVCVLIMIPLRAGIYTSTTGRCISYITSGQAADFKAQTDAQTDILEASDGGDVVIPAASDEQGPLQHMPVTPDTGSYTNRVTAAYYGVDSVRIEE